MQAVAETLFDAIYLITVITIGTTMIVRNNGNKQYRLFGIMAVVLGAGDAFHLVPRALALCTTGLDNFTVALGMGKFITSITMTVFYVILYYVWRVRYKIKGQSSVFLSCAAHFIMLFSTESMDYKGCASLLGDLPEYSLCIAGGANNCPVL